MPLTFQLLHLFKPKIFSYLWNITFIDDTLSQHVMIFQIPWSISHILCDNLWLFFYQVMFSEESQRYIVFFCNFLSSPRGVSSIVHWRPFKKTNMALVVMLLAVIYKRMSGRASHEGVGCCTQAGGSRGMGVMRDEKNRCKWGRCIFLVLARGVAWTTSLGTFEVGLASFEALPTPSMLLDWSCHTNYELDSHRVIETCGNKSGCHVLVLYSWAQCRSPPISTYIFYKYFFKY